MLLRQRQLNMRTPSVSRFRLPIFVLLSLLIVVVPVIISSSSQAALLTYRRLQLSDGSVSSTGVKYNFIFNTNTSGPIGSISFDICSNYLYEPTDICTPPAGMNTSAVSLTAQSGITDFTLNPVAAGHTLLLSRPAPGNTSPQQLALEFSNITNPSQVGSNYVRIATYPTVDGSGPEVDYGVVVFALNPGIGISTEVPPYLLFCTGITIDGYNCGTAAGSYISFGELSSKTPRSATSQLLASTNAPYGYSVILDGTTMTAGTNTIPAANGTPSAIGTSQFGINGRANSVPSVGTDPVGPGLINPRSGYNTPNIFRFAAGDIVASSNNTDDYRKLTMSYIVNVSPGQSAGRYVATVSYICLANF